MKFKKTILNFTIFLFIFSILFSSCEKKMTPGEAKEIAKEAYVYGFPMVVNYKTMYNYTLNEKSPEYKAAFNEKSCEARVFTPEDKAIVTPNSDTPYCMFWLDIRSEPIVLSVPEMEDDRYYSFQLIDLYTHNFAYLGTLSTGNKAGKYIVAKEGWKGEKPNGITDILYSETDLFFVVVRTQLIDANDLPNVKAIQEKYQIQELSSFLGEEPVKAAKIDNSLAWNDGDEFTVASLNYMNFMLNLTKPVASEVELRNKFAKLGLGTEKGFDINSFDEETQKAIEEGMQAGLKKMTDFATEVTTTDPMASTKIFGTRDFLTKSAKGNYNLDNFYVLRAIAAQHGLYGNSAQEAIYPTYLMEAAGVPYDAAKFNYTLTFKKDELPPVNAFWSFSIYDGITQLFIHNELDRYLLNSNMLEDFVYNEDGSLTFYMQKDAPEDALKANWLPAPNGPFYCTMRLYGPKEEAVNGEWINPPLLKLVK
ncbi:DUF1254 domain-containing protein [Lentimicrobium sp. S6]|uniref:DUF1254 domain-containing protein n=1 Tax=Lentimicrobium sp. S6 TaxID=2735872 RepID=UPI001554DA67|nr:DUF1254 domain-containing protein [Lentimicrobium sp. S6]NPD44248.1 DUF1254 domain-containing protein [Lentimicrobium sp. S6]